MVSLKSDALDGIFFGKGSMHRGGRRASASVGVYSEGKPTTPEERPVQSETTYTMHVLNESSEIHFWAYKHSSLRETLFKCICLLTLGLPLLLCKWWPQWKCRWRMLSCPLPEAQYILACNQFKEYEILPIDTQQGRYKRFYYRYCAFFIHLKSGRLYTIADLEESDPTFVQQSTHQSRFVYGLNLLNLPEPRKWRLLVDEVLHPFNVFQVASVLIWCLESYYLYAGTILLISAGSIALTLQETYSTARKLRQMSHFTCPVTSIQGEIFDSSLLLPGQEISLHSLSIVPADLILTAGGSVLVDESMLTGESVPVSKSSPSSILFAGTKILRADPSARGRVHRTAFSTVKGQLLLSILFPRPLSFSFQSDAMKYVYGLSFLAVLGFLFSLYSQVRLGVSPYFIATRALDLITVVVPPALPATLSIGVLFSLQRLRKHRLSCSSPSKINQAASVDIVCFDKTGTLTSDGLSLVSVLDGECRLLRHPSQAPALLQCMRYCHTLEPVDCELIGDPLDKEMFLATGSDSLEERDLVFDFCPQLRRMSVIIDSKIYCKGSPESIAPLCSELPANFWTTLRSYSSAGYRVIACAHRQIDTLSGSREECESDLHFAGLLVFENVVKEESVGVIEELSRADLLCLMVTGDSVLTAVSVARKCNILGADDSDIGDILESVDIVEDLTKTDSTAPLAMTGNVFRWLLNQPSLNHLIAGCRVFARMSPEDKRLLVSFHQSKGRSVCFCGDGANDCGALRAADVGICLSRSAEASVAAPFSCASLWGVGAVLREGRAALETSFACFKFMALYSMIQFTSLLLLYSKGLNLGDYQFVVIDLVMILPVGALMARFPPRAGLGKSRVESKLLSRKVLLSLGSQITLQALLQIITSTRWNRTSTVSSTSTSYNNNFNTRIFLTSLFAYVMGAGLFGRASGSRGHYWPFYGYLLVLIGFGVYLTIFGGSVLSQLLELVVLSREERWSILGGVGCYVIISLIVEWIL